jgi:hypothetical protein
MFLRKRLPPRLRDPHMGDSHPAPARDPRSAFAVASPSADYVGQHLDRDTMGRQKRFGVAPVTDAMRYPRHLRGN